MSSLSSMAVGKEGSELQQSRVRVRKWPACLQPQLFDYAMPLPEPAVPFYACLNFIVYLPAAACTHWDYLHGWGG